MRWECVRVCVERGKQQDVQDTVPLHTHERTTQPHRARAQSARCKYAQTNERNDERLLSHARELRLWQASQQRAAERATARLGHGRHKHHGQGSHTRGHERTLLCTRRGCKHSTSHRAHERTFFLMPFFAVAAFILASLVFPAAGPFAPLCVAKAKRGVEGR
jgi:hypothetical protein